MIWEMIQDDLGQGLWKAGDIGRGGIMAILSNYDDELLERFDPAYQLVMALMVFDLWFLLLIAISFHY